MTDRQDPFSPAAQARLAGLFYLAVIILGIVTLQLRGGLIVRGDALASAANIAGQPFAFRMSLLAEVAASLAYVAVVVLLYRLMLPAGRTLATLSLGFGLAGCTAGAVAAIYLALPLTAMADAPGGLTAAQMTSVAAGLYSFGYKTALIFFGCYCLCLGALTIRSAFLPSALGYLLIVSGLSWLTTGVATYVSADAARAVGTFALAGGGLGETLFTLWLLFAGVDAEAWRRQTAEARA